MRAKVAEPDQTEMEDQKTLVALLPAEAPAWRPTALEAYAPFSSRLIGGALLTLFGFVALAAVWLAGAPISSAVIAPAIVSVDTHRKLIQHLEGGIIDQILVKNGDHVLPGKVLVKLRHVAACTHVAPLRAQYADALSLISQ